MISDLALKEVILFTGSPVWPMPFPITHVPPLIFCYEQHPFSRSWFGFAHPGGSSYWISLLDPAAPGEVRYEMGISGCNGLPLKTSVL